MSAKSVVDILGCFSLYGWIRSEHSMIRINNKKTEALTIHSGPVSAAESADFFKCRPKIHQLRLTLRLWLIIAF